MRSRWILKFFVWSVGSEALLLFNMQHLNVNVNENSLYLYSYTWTIGFCDGTALTHAPAWMAFFVWFILFTFARILMSRQNDLLIYGTWTTNWLGNNAKCVEHYWSVIVYTILVRPRHTGRELWDNTLFLKYLNSPLFFFEHFSSQMHFNWNFLPRPGMHTIYNILIYFRWVRTHLELNHFAMNFITYLFHIEFSHKNELQLLLQCRHDND